MLPAVMLTLSLGTVINNTVSAQPAPDCFSFTLSCGVQGNYCPEKNQSIDSIIDDILILDDVICH